MRIVCFFLRYSDENSSVKGKKNLEAIAQDITLLGRTFRIRRVFLNAMVSQN